MNVHDWKLYDKSGSPLNWTADPLIQLSFDSSTGLRAEGYLVTNPSSLVIDTKITNGGYSYTDTTNAYTTNVFYHYALGDGTAVSLTSTDISIFTTDISIFNPDPSIVKSIDSLTVDISTIFIYPSVTYAAAVFLNPISQGLIETEHLYIFEDTSSGYARPIDTENQYLVFEFVGKDDEIKFFEVDENTQEITWSNALAFDVSTWAPNTPLQIDIGFKADQEGVYERTLRIYHYVGDTLHILGDILVNAEAIGEDERFRSLISNFGLPDPKGMKDIFKRSDINEDLPDWELLNYKSKHIILEHDKIMPFVGTYKALINAIKWLGYDDIWIREWFLNVKENRKLSLVVPFDADDRMQTILQFNADQRKALKKLNQLSLNYCITRETGTFDVWGTPETENCYAYNLREVFIKLLGLKKWLEENIIGVNCRIIDITGEGIYFERVQNLIYATDNMEYAYSVHQSLTPYAVDESSELVKGDSSISLSLKELFNTHVNDLPYRFIDMADTAWTHTDPSKYFSLTDPSYLADTSSFLLIGATFSYPFSFITDIMYRLSVEKDDAGVVGHTLVTNPLFIHENDIKYYNVFDTSSVFFDTSTSLTIYLENAYIRDACVDEWDESISYTISPYNYLDIGASTIKVLYNSGTYTINSGKGIVYREGDTSISYNTYFNPISFTLESSGYIITELASVVVAPYNDQYKLETSTGATVDFNDYVTLNPGTNALLQYAYDSNYHVPLLSFKNYKYTDASGVTADFPTDKLYHLDILDGKIEMNAGMENPANSSDNTMMYINWNYDTSLEEQMITVNVIYDSPRMRLWQIDPSVYYWADPSGLTGGNATNIYVQDNSVYKMHVNHIGEYNIEVFGWDDYNTLFYNYAKDPYDVWIKTPKIYALLDSSRNFRCASTFMFLDEVSALINSNLYPIYDRSIPLQGLTFGEDADGSTYINVPSITYFQDVPEADSINKFYNMTERVTSISGTNIVVDDDYQKFYTGDNVNLIKFDKGKYSSLVEASSYIVTASGSNPTTITLDQMPSGITLDSSTEVYILNDTYRFIENASNGTGNYFTADISGYAFEENQLVAVIVTDGSKSGYEWGASYRVTDVDGSIHLFDYPLPEFFLNDPGKYTIRVKHAFSSYSTFTIPTDTASEINNVFKIYLNDSYCHEQYLDSTFMYENILFDQELINEHWYDPSIYDVSAIYYKHNIYVDLADTSTFVIFKSEFDPSDYMLNPKNIWTARYNNDNKIYFKVYNNVIPYTFDSSNYYSLGVETYDNYGNISQNVDNLIIRVSRENGKS